jgi:hypothetical protein
VDTDPLTSLRRGMNRLFTEFTRDWAAPATFATSGFLSPKVNVVPRSAAAEKQIKKIAIKRQLTRMKDGDGFNHLCPRFQRAAFPFWHRSFQDSASAIEGH